METPKFDPQNRPQQGAALFRWILEKRKADEANQSPEDKARIEATKEALRKENAERGTPIVSVQLPV